MDADKVARVVEAVRQYAEDVERVAAAFRTCAVCGCVSRTGALAFRHYMRHSKRDRELADLFEPDEPHNDRDPLWRDHFIRNAAHADDLLNEARKLMDEMQLLRVALCERRLKRALDDVDDYLGEVEVHGARIDMDRIIGHLLYD
jgi:hypothetical protein